MGKHPKELIFHVGFVKFDMQIFETSPQTHKAAANSGVIGGGRTSSGNQ